MSVRRAYERSFSRAARPPRPFPVEELRCWRRRMLGAHLGAARRQSRGARRRVHRHPRRSRCRHHHAAPVPRRPPSCRRRHDRAPAASMSSDCLLGVERSTADASCGGHRARRRYRSGQRYPDHASSARARGTRSHDHHRDARALERPSSRGSRPPPARRTSHAAAAPHRLSPSRRAFACSTDTGERNLPAPAENHEPIAVNRVLNARAARATFGTRVPARPGTVRA